MELSLADFGMCVSRTSGATANITRILGNSNRLCVRYILHARLGTARLVVILPRDRY